MPIVVLAVAGACSGESSVVRVRDEWHDMPLLDRIRTRAGAGSIGVVSARALRLEEL